MNDLGALVTRALSRRRTHLVHATEYDHAGLRAWVMEALGAGWSVFSPTTNDQSPSANWPKDSRLATCEAALEKLLPEHLKAQADDMLCGHCEEMAVLVTRAAADVLTQRSAAGGGGAPAIGPAPPDTVVDDAQRRVTEELGAMASADDAVALVFGKHVGPHAQWVTGPALWNAALPDLCKERFPDATTEGEARRRTHTRTTTVEPRKSSMLFSSSST